MVSNGVLAIGALIGAEAAGITNFSGGAGDSGGPIVDTPDFDLSIPQGDSPDIEFPQMESNYPEGFKDLLNSQNQTIETLQQQLNNRESTSATDRLAQWQMLNSLQNQGQNFDPRNWDIPTPTNQGNGNTPTPTEGRDYNIQQDPNAPWYIRTGAETFGQTGQWVQENPIGAAGTAGAVALAPFTGGTTLAAVVGGSWATEIGVDNKDEAVEWTSQTGNDIGNWWNQNTPDINLSGNNGDNNSSGNSSSSSMNEQAEKVYHGGDIGTVLEGLSGVEEIDPRKWGNSSAEQTTNEETTIEQYKKRWRENQGANDSVSSPGGGGSGKEKLK